MRVDNDIRNAGRTVGQWLWEATRRAVRPALRMQGMERFTMVSLGASAPAEKRVLVDEICAHSATTPSLIAMECGTRTLTYRALRERLGERLRELSGLMANGD